MIKTLVVNGCSWSEGHLLHWDQQVEEEIKPLGYRVAIDNRLAVYLEGENGGKIGVEYPYRDIYDRYNFGSHVKQYLKAREYINLASGGAGNDRIVRTTIDYIKRMKPADYKKTFFLIGWSLPERQELFVNDKKGDKRWVRFNPTQEFSSLEGDIAAAFTKQLDKYWKQYVTHVHSQQAGVMHYFKNIFLLKNTLENLGIKYYFFNSFPMFWDSDYDCAIFDNDVAWYNEQSSTSPLLEFHDNFFDFIQDCSNTETVKLEDGHPNALGHKLWATHLIQDMRNRGII